MRFNHLRRREFITLLGGAAVICPRPGLAQQPERTRRVGVLMLFADTDPQSVPRVTAFEQGLAKLGWIVGRNLQIDYRWSANDDERARAASVEVLKLAPDVVLAHARPALAALQQATRAVPIVFTTVNEPIAQGFVQSLAHPGGNTTGFSYLESTLGAKWLELLKEIAPGLTRVAVMWQPETDPINEAFYRLAEAAAPKFAVQVFAATVHQPDEIEAVMTVLARESGGGVIVPPNTLTTVHRQLIIKLADRYRLPAIYGSRNFRDEGGLVFYGANPVEQFRQAADYVDRILRGEKPGDLPVVQPTKFELVINLKTAKALGLTVPLIMQMTADEVIE